MPHAISPRLLSKPSRLFTLGVFAVSLLGAAPMASAATYLGKICLLSTVTDRETGPVSPPQTFTVEYDVTQLGGTSYAITGYVNIPGQPFVTTGTGVIVGGEMVINVTTSQSHTDSSWRDTGINQTKLNLSTMSGTFYEIGHDYDPASNSWDSRYTAGTVALTTCP